MARRFNTFFLIGLLSLVVCVRVHGEDYRYRNQKKGISLSLPGQFALQKKDDGDILLVAREQDDPSSLPSMTLVSQIGDPKVDEKTVGALANDVVDSYRAVGLVDAQSTGKPMMAEYPENGAPEAAPFTEASVGEKMELAGRTVFFTRVSYTRGDVPLTAGIYIFPAAETYFVLTLIDTADHSPSSLPLLHAVARSVSIVGKAPESPTINDQQAVVIWWFIGAIVIGASAMLITWLYGKRSKEN